MNNNYEPVIGLEVHVELSTKSKMFCRCSADYFGKAPNTHTCPVCLGLPGALPYINEKAIEDCLKIGLALNCSVSEISRFERKNYFYPDLPKGFQISQYRWPLCINGQLTIDNGKVIRINRVHQEEDTAKLTHQFGNQKSKIKNQNLSLIDFNRSGVPLVEIVTEPDFHDSSQVKDFAQKLQQLFRYLGVSKADMEKGDMRLEANVSVRKIGSHPELDSGSRMPKQVRHDKQELPNYRIELKNINSFRFIVGAIEYEIKRQIEALERGERLVQETRGWNEAKKKTFLQRSKEEAHDYRYFPEPDLPKLTINSGQLTKIRESLPELPWDKAKRLILEYGISPENAKILTGSRKLADYFEETTKLGKVKHLEPQQIANYLINQKTNIQSVPTSQIIKDILSRKSGVITDLAQLEKWTEEVLAVNPKSSKDYKKGKTAALNVLIGGVMRKSEGRADIKQVREILEQKLVE